MTRATMLFLAVSGTVLIGGSYPPTGPVGDGTPTITAVDVECRCCKRNTGTGHHQFNTTVCSELSTPYVELGSALAAQFQQRERRLPSEESETGEYFTSVSSGLGKLAAGLGAVTLGEEAPCETEMGWTCNKAWSGGGSGGGSGCDPDCNFHTEPAQGACNGPHPLCGEESELVVEVLNAVDLGNYGLVAAYIKGQPSKMWLNSAREMLQIQDCQGRIATQVRVDVARLTELLQ